MRKTMTLRTLRRATRADFRARREALGLSMADVSREMGIQDRACKRWERGGERDAFPPDDAWDVLEGYEELRPELSSRIAKCADADAEGHVYLPYFHSQPEYDALPLPEAPGRHVAFTFANTCLRDAAAALEAQGLEVDFVFPNESLAGGTGSLACASCDDTHKRGDREPDYLDRT